MAFLGLIYALAAIAAPAMHKFLGRAAFYISSLIPAAAFAWTVAQYGRLSGKGSGYSVETSWQWVPQLGLSLSLRMDMLAWLMMLIINGAGALIMIYCASYFPKQARGLGRFISFFLAFALAMNGLVLADHLLVLYLFWEMTALFSFLLIGHHFTFPNARGSARQAFIVTTFGSLAMFGGFFAFQSVSGGTFLISQLIARMGDGTIDPTQPAVIAGVFLIAIGAASKSAMLPLHFWLPGAMAAPTPVSAFLHAASMVKAGIYLMLRFSPVFVQVPGFWLVSVLGAATMLVGAYRALRQRDLKLVLAYGTVSQLGFMMSLAAWGTPASQMACVGVLIAHATFKSALFLCTGTVEKLSGTRDLSELSGFGRQHKMLAAAAGLACLSMAGIPITMGYVAKEAAIHGLLHGSPASLCLLGAIAVGSVMTLGYALRYWWGAFATKSVMRKKPSEDAHAPARDSAAAPVALVGVPLVLALTTVGLGFAPSFVERAAAPIGVTGFVDAGGTPMSIEQAHLHLSWWSGIGPALITAVIIAGGLAMFWQRGRVGRLQRRVEVPERASAAHLYAVSIRLLEAGAGRLVALIQRGSLPWDLVIILATTLVALSAASWWGHVQVPTSIHLADYWLEVELGIIIVVAALMAVRAARRLTAAIALGVVGASVATLFFTFGGPDLALTQLVVEAVTLLIFVLVFRRLPGYFSERPMRATKFFRAILAVLVGVAVIAVGLVVTAARKHLPVSALLPEEVKEFGHGNNIVNVILVDVRAWDTVGELTVLLVAALGVTSLVYAKAMQVYLNTSRSEHRRRIAQRVEIQRRRLEKIKKQRAKKALNHAQVRRPRTRTPHSWLHGAAALPLEQRSMVMEVSVRVLFHTLMLVSVWLLLIGHNNPGGGFVAGMTAGIALAVRYIAGGRFELFAAAPFKPGHVLGLGLFIAAMAGVIPVLAGHAAFQTIPIDISLGFAGHIHFTTAIFLDIGVYIVVMGVVLDILSSLGSEIDRQREEEELSRGKGSAQLQPAGNGREGAAQ